MRKPIRRAAVIGAGVMGSGIAAHLANAGVEVLLMDIVPPNLTRRREEATAPRANRFAAGGPREGDQGASRRVLPQGPGAARLGRQRRGRSREAGAAATSSSRRSSSRSSRSGRSSRSSRRSSRALHRRVEHERPAHRRDDEGPLARSFRKRFLVMHFFNPVRYMKLLELVAGPDTSAETLERVRRFGEDVLGKGIVVGKDTPNFVGNRIGTPRDDDDDPPDARRGPGARGRRRASPASRWATRRARASARRISSGSTPSCTSPTTATRRSRPTRTARSSRCRRTSGRWSRRSSSATRPRAASTSKGKDGVGRDARPEDARVPRPRRRQGDPRRRARSSRKIEDPRERVRKLVADAGQGRASSRGRCSRDRSRTRRGAWARSPTTSSRSMTRCAGATTGSSARSRHGTRSGFEAVVDRMKKDGVALPASIDKMRASGAKSFYTDDGQVFDLARRRVRRSARRPAHRAAAGAPQGQRAGAQERRRRGLGPGRRRARAHLQDEGEQHRLRRHQDDRRRRRARPRRDFRALVVANQGEHFCVGANLFLVVMAAQQKEWEQIRAMVRRLPGAPPAHEVRAASRSSPRPTA